MSPPRTTKARISDNFDVQQKFEFFNKKPILDENAEAILRKYTKRKEGISDAPKNLEDRIRAKPGFGLPLLHTVKNEVETLLPNGELKKLPVATIAINNMSDSYKSKRVRPKKL